MENEQITTLEQALMLVTETGIDAIGAAMRANSMQALELWAAWWLYKSSRTEKNAARLITKAEQWRVAPDMARKGY